MAAKQIETEEQYQNSLSWLVMKAAILSDPLTEPEEKAKIRATYDYVAEQVQRYRRAELAEKFPGLRQVYAELGWEVADRKQEPPKSEPEPEPQKQEEKPSVNLSDWLDD